MSGPDQPFVLRDTDARGVVTLTLNRPLAFNALSEEMLTALQTELDAIAKDEAARVVVLAAAGKAFCAGHDLKQMRAAPSLGANRKLFAQCSRMMLSLQRLPVPVIARVHGIATAAGCQLVAMCDLAVATEDARFAKRMDHVQPLFQVLCAASPLPDHVAIVQDNMHGGRAARLWSEWPEAMAAATDLLGGRAPEGELAQRLAFPPGKGDAWLRHNIEEVGMFEHFLPALYQSEMEC